VDLAQRFSLAWRAAGASDDGAALCQRLLAAWGQPHRRYHALTHLQACLALFDQHRAEAKAPEEVELALWFHDAVYDPTARDNEEQSAAWASDAMAAAGISSERAARVAALVLATKTHQAQGDDAALLLGIDLSILGAPAAAFDQFDREVRAEYAWVDALSWRAGRGRVLKGFLQRPKIFTHPALAPLEAKARENLARTVAALERGVGWGRALGLLALSCAALAGTLLGLGAYGEGARRVPKAERPKVVVTADAAEAVRTLEREGVHGAVLIELGRNAGLDEGNTLSWLPKQKSDFAVPFAVDQRSAAHHARAALSRATAPWAATKLGPARQLVQVLTPRAWSSFTKSPGATCEHLNDDATVVFVCKAIPPLREPAVAWVRAGWFDDSSVEALMQLAREARLDAPLWVVSLERDDPAVTPRARETAEAFAQAVGAQ
jgi:predicted metal-dependent HD superfamily phosphohydrolase